MIIIHLDMILTNTTRRRSARERSDTGVRMSVSNNSGLSNQHIPFQPLTFKHTAPDTQVIPKASLAFDREDAKRFKILNLKN